MKTIIVIYKKILKLLIFSLFLLFIGHGCEKNEIEYADESIVVNNKPGVAIYKTKKDYFDYITVKVNSSGELTMIPDYTLNDPRIDLNDKGKIFYNSRWRLKSGYMVEIGLGPNESFAKITFQEYVDYHTKNGVVMPEKLISPKIIDTDPFTEFYHMGCLNCAKKEFTLEQIGVMINNGTLEEHFERIK